MAAVLVEQIFLHLEGTLVMSEEKKVREQGKKEQLLQVFCLKAKTVVD